MKELLNRIDAKLITSVGGILLAGFLAFTLYKVLTNDLSHLGKAIEKQADVQSKTNDVLLEYVSVLEANTEILRILERRIK